MLIFFDTEFTELCLDPRLISIGLVSEDSQHLAQKKIIISMKICNA